MNTIQTQQLLRIMSLADQNHWGFRVKEEKGMISTPEYKNQWWYIPVKEDEEIIHENAKMRVKAIERSGVKIQGLVLGHESPRLLQAPPKVKQVKPKTDLSFIPLLLLNLGIAALLDPALYVVLEDGTWVEVMTWYE